MPSRPVRSAVIGACAVLLLLSNPVDAAPGEPDVPAVPTDERPPPPPPPPVGDAGASALAPLPDDTVDLLTHGLDQLREKHRLLVLAAPENADDPDHDVHRADLFEANRQVASVLFELDERGIEVSEELRRTMSLPPPGAGPPPRQGPEVQLAAMLDLEEMIAERQPVQPAASPSPSSADATTDATVDVSSSDSAGADANSPGADEASGSSWLLLAGLITLVVASTSAVAVLLGRRRRRTELAHAREEALTDPLTGLANRRRLDHDIDVLEDSPIGEVAVMMVDIDHFKSFNDRHGHLVGDEVLARVGDALREAVRATDIVYRYGGEEFCVLLPDTDAEAARDVAERIHEVLAESTDERLGELTVSIGLSEGATEDIGHAITVADDALFDAKRAGRNRTVVTAS